jgi:GNAT superfamily N-acetyltransferase
MAAIDVFIASTGQAGVVGRLLYEFNTEFETPGPRAEEFAARFKFLLARTDMLALLSGTPAAPTGLAFLTLRPAPYYDGPLAQLEELHVQPGLRGQGVGTASASAAERRYTSTSMSLMKTPAAFTNATASPISSRAPTAGCCATYASSNAGTKETKTADTGEASVADRGPSFPRLEGIPSPQVWQARMLAGVLRMMFC